MDKHMIRRLIDEINLLATEEIKIMEVCGTHTQMISKLGLRSLLSSNIKLLSGPGCPVCVSEESYIDNAIEILNKYNLSIATFGDMMRVRGTKESLIEEKSKGKDVRIIYSPLDLVDMAEKNKDKNIVFLGVGFETTAPVIALAIKTAAERKIKNLFFFTSIKLMPPILHYIMKQPDNKISGLICPGNVAAVAGSDYFRFIADEYGISAAVCGFEAEDLLIGIHHLVKQIMQNEKKDLKNSYRRCVTPQGNPSANKLIKDVFEVSHGGWRGIGTVENSSLYINEQYKNFDALHIFTVENRTAEIKTNCECKDVLLGNKTPKECKFFDKFCNPIKAYGPCMVSAEGSCSIAYRYREEI